MNNIDRNQKLTIGIILSVILIIIASSLILWDIIDTFLFEKSMMLSLYFSVSNIFYFVFLILYAALLYFLSNYLKTFALNSVRISFYILIGILILSLNSIIFILSDDVNIFIYTIINSVNEIFRFIAILLYVYIGINLLYFKKDNIGGLHLLGICFILIAVLLLVCMLGYTFPLYKDFSTDIVLQQYFAILGIINKLAYLLPIGSILLLFIKAQGYLAKNQTRI